ncbi:MAG: hypothetical protein GXO21_04000 [Aquificae bacterium]|nr:hypothetical protein [Aquificota bacterium]
MRKILLSCLGLGLLEIGLAADIENPVIRKLYEKGIFTKEEAIKLEKEIKNEHKKKIKKIEKKLVKHASVINQKSPEFLLGKETGPNIKIRAFDNPDMYIKVGIRIQGTFENYKVDYKDPTKSDIDTWDAYLRRTRLEIGAGFGKHTSFTMDIRNDKANYQDKGEQEFNVGDAYLKIKKPFGTSLVNFKFYRAKIDVSRTETVKSAWVVHYDRPHVADEAAQFISHNRRATNAQIYGNWHKKIHYQLAFGDAVYSGKFYDAINHKSLSDYGGKIVEQDFFYGGKIILSPIPGWEETKRTETYFGVGKHVSVGIGYWRVPKIKFSLNSNTYEIDRTLLNYEFSAHYKGAFIQAEYFDFDGVVKDWTAIDLEVGKSKGWYITGEYVFPNFYYIAPFARYEEWKRWDSGEGDYKLKSTIFGLNWYLRGNTTKIGISYQKDKYGKDIGDKDIDRLKFTSQWFF